LDVDIVKPIDFEKAKHDGGEGCTWPASSTFECCKEYVWTESLRLVVKWSILDPSTYFRSLTLPWQMSESNTTTPSIPYLDSFQTIAFLHAVLEIMQDNDLTVSNCQSVCAVLDFLCSHNSSISRLKDFDTCCGGPFIYVFWRGNQEVVRFGE
jgi:hypothetical protein